MEVINMQTLCAACQRKLEKIVMDDPHAALQKLATPIVYSSTAGNYAEEIYRCDDCGTTMSRAIEPSSPETLWKVAGS